MRDDEDLQLSLLTDEVKQTGQRLIEALAEICRDDGLSEYEAEGGIACLIGGFDDYLESRVGR